MTKIESKSKTVNKEQGTVYRFLENINNWEHLMPDRVTNWKSDENSCNFTIQGTADLGMVIKEKSAPSKLKLQDFGKVPFPFEFLVTVEEKSSSECLVQFTFNADLNPMLKLMAVNPLKNFLNILVDKLNELEF